MSVIFQPLSPTVESGCPGAPRRFRREPHPAQVIVQIYNYTQVYSSMSIIATKRHCQYANLKVDGWTCVATSLLNSVAGLAGLHRGLYNNAAAMQAHNKNQFNGCINRIWTSCACHSVCERACVRAREVRLHYCGGAAKGGL